MRTDTLPETILKTVAPADVQRYAEGAGWIRNNAVKDIALFSHPTIKFLQVIVPVDDTFDDYAAMIRRAISKFAEAENREDSQILNELLIPSSDLLRFQITGPNSKKGIVPINEGASLYAGMRDSLLAAARGAIEPRRYYPTLAVKAAEEFLQGCWLGQTERSSYVATVSCPMGVLPERKEELPFARRTTGLLLNSIAAVVNAVDKKQEERLIDLQDENIVVSANLCDAIVEMQPKDETTSLNVRCAWAKSLPPDPATFINSVTVKATQIEVIEKVAKALRPQLVEVKERDYIGTIEQLKSEPNIAERVLGEVIILIAVNGRPRHVRVELTPKDYNVACNAHRDGNAVSFRGKLMQGVRIFRIESPKDFKMLPKS